MTQSCKSGNYQEEFKVLTRADPLGWNRIMREAWVHNMKTCITLWKGQSMSLQNSDIGDIVNWVDSNIAGWIKMEAQ